LALDGCCSGTAHVLEDRPPGPGELPPMAWYSSVTDGYFEAMGIDIVSGRSFTIADRDSSAAVIIVSQALARKYWPDSDPLGKRIRLSSDSTGWRTIVGVAASVRDRRLEDDPSEMVYYPAGYAVPSQSRSLAYVLRTARTDAVAAPARQEVWALDRNLPVASTQTLEKVVAASVVRTSFTMLALVVAAVIALFLGAIGLYGVISYLVTQRTNEIGIRMALGARPGEVRRMVVLQGVRLSALGLVVGFAGALGLTRLMQGMLFGTAPTDPLTFGIVVTFLAAIALLASYLPARRASRIDPASSLKAE
jgi:putative ABC transport system permease protein